MQVPRSERRITPFELSRMPDNNTLELINGRIQDKGADSISSLTMGHIAYLFCGFTEGEGRAIIYPGSLGYQCFQMIAEDPDRIRKADVSVLTKKRRRLIDDPNPDFIPIHPDLAVEVLSRTVTHGQLTDRLSDFRAAGFPLVWIVHPILQTVTVYPNPGDPLILKQHQTIDAPSALPGFSCKVADLFPPT